MCTIVCKNGNTLKVVSGLDRLEAQLQVYGEATVVLADGVIAVEKDGNGQRVETTRQIH